MSDLDELDLFTTSPDATALERKPRTCRRHVWVGMVFDAPGTDWAERNRARGVPTHYRCRVCSAVRDDARARRGKSSRRLGHDGERRSEKRYGWRKVGEYGGITDLEGTLAVVQQKTSRRAPPAAWLSIFRALEARAGGRIPLVLLSFVRAGVDTEDFIVLRGRDWIQLHGKDDNPERDNAAFGVATRPAEGGRE